jgi:hypothetical protein
MLQTLQVIYLQCLVYVSPVISEKMVEMIKTNSGSKSVQVFNVCLYLHCRWRSNYNEGNPFCEVNDLRCEVVVRFANIEGIVYHHCLKLLFIEMAIPQKFQWAKQFYIVPVSQTILHCSSEPNNFTFIHKQHIKNYLFTHQHFRSVFSYVPPIVDYILGRRRKPILPHPWGTCHVLFLVNLLALHLDNKSKCK